ncbi:MAG: alanine racemase [Clostridiaceae bacterium]|nr:alanine racemase [Clostridiaceae bacterium]
MEKQELGTPAILLDLDILGRNLRRYQDACDRYGKQLWPMVKTHKSLEIARMQADMGAKGFLCGTLDECEALCGAGFHRMMYAYPVAGETAILRVIALAARCEFLIRLDCMDAVPQLHAAAQKIGVTVGYTIIVDSGFHRFGIAPECAADFARQMEPYSAMRLRGISTHPGQVYGAAHTQEIAACAEAERTALKTAAEGLRRAGYAPELVTTGATPTFVYAVEDAGIDVYHPGNYVFNDCIQISNGTASEDDCALTVLATVISHNAAEQFLCDAGAKCLGLDRGAHGNASIPGYGRVKGHPELLVAALSEEVGKLTVTGETKLQVGDRIEIIPNHACSVANLTSYYVGTRGTKVERLIRVDVRGNSKPLLNTTD